MANPLFEFFLSFDLLAEHIHLTYKGKKSHPTFCGSLMSVLLIAILAFTLNKHAMEVMTLSGNEYFQSNIYHKPDANFMQLTKDKLDFSISFVGVKQAKNFDQNKFYTFKLHKYTNVRDNNTTLPKYKKRLDEIIPMLPC